MKDSESQRVLAYSSKENTAPGPVGTVRRVNSALLSARR